MEQVSQFVSGERDYTKIRGGTGPLVYPAAHVYTYTGLYYLTDEGKNILLAQKLFAVLYVVTLGVVMRCYRNARVSKRYIIQYETRLTCRNRCLPTSFPSSSSPGACIVSLFSVVSTTVSPSFFCSSPFLPSRITRGELVSYSTHGGWASKCPYCWCSPRWVSSYS